MRETTRTKRYAKNQMAEAKKPPIQKYSSQKKKVVKNPKEKKKVSKNIKKEVKPHRKIRYKNVLLAFLFLTFFGIFLYFLCTVRVQNLYVKGNSMLSDQEILDLAGLSEYPSMLSILTKNIKKKLEEEEFILSAHIQYGIRKVIITVKENRPLYYYESSKKTILENKKETDKKFVVPTVINYIPNTVSFKFHEKMKEVDLEILKRISEIEYKPDEVDTSRFLLTMNDGNYVYLTLNKWDAVNRYVSIMKEFPNQKGILYLNAGNSFEILEK